MDRTGPDAGIMAPATRRMTVEEQSRGAAGQFPDNLRGLDGSLPGMGKE